MKFETIYKSHCKEIKIFVYRMVLNEEVVKDITQETFLKLHVELNNQKTEKLKNPRAWLFKVAYNLSINAIKENRKRNNHENFNLTAHTCSVEEGYTKKEVQKQIRNAVKKLESRDRALIMLYKESFSYAEMADILEMNVNSIGKTLTRAIDKLKKELKGELYEMPR